MITGITGYDAAGCSGWDQMSVSTISNQINAGSDQTICLGSSTTLNGSGGSNYVWDNGVTNGVPFMPTATTYTVTGLGANGCMGTDQVDISQYVPFINAGPSFLNVCEGNSVLLSGSGGVSYVWDNNVIDSVAFIPTTSTLYTVIGADTAGCTNTDQIQVNVIPLPVVDAGADITICAGDPVTLTATGANGYSWDNNVSNNSPFTPTSTATYTVIGVDGNNCQGTDMVTVTVIATSSSTIDANGIDQYVLNGEIYTMSGTYTQVLTNANGCDSIITINLSLGFTTVNESTSFSINHYPNPASTILNIDVIDDLNENLSLVVYSADGRVVKNINIYNPKSQIDISDLAMGNYIASLQSANGKLKQFMFVKE